MKTLVTLKVRKLPAIVDKTDRLFLQKVLLTTVVSGWFFN